MEQRRYEKKYRMIRMVLLVGLFLSFGLTSFSQQRTVTGNVTSSDDGLGIPGVSVSVKGTAVGTITDIDGKYVLSVPQNGTTMVFSFVGMETQEKQISSNQIDVVMKTSFAQVDEVVVTALGIKRDVKALGYSATSINGEDAVKANTVNPVAALQGKVAGLSVANGDGGLFGSSRIEIRGISTLNSENNQPIFVIDGVILENNIANVGSHDWNQNSGDFGNMLKNLNVENYESVNVLKGAAATALYGSRGINGAVVIKTKDGAGAKGLGVVVSQSTSLDHVYAQPDFQYVKGPGNYYGNRSYLPTGSFDQGFYSIKINGVNTPSLNGVTGRMFGPAYDANVMVEDYDGQLIPYVPVKDHFKKAYELGWGSNTNIALQGGDERGNFYLSTGYTVRQGNMPENKFDKTSLFFSGSRKLSNYLKVDASVSVTNSNSKNPPRNIGEIFTEGTWSAMYDVDKWKKRGVFQAPHGGTPRSGDDYERVPGNSVWFGEYINENLRNETLVRPIVKVTANPTSWMTVMAEANINYYTIKGEQKNLGQGYQNEGGYYSLWHQNELAKNGKISVSFDKTFGDISNNLMLLGEMWSQEKSRSGAYTDGGLVVPGQFFIGNSKNTPKISDTNIYGTKQINSFLFKYSADWKGQLYIDVTGRNDWSSALVYTNGTGSYSYFYPSVSTSWLFSDTFADQMPSFISFGKLRASWAQVGNDTDPFAINKGYSTGNIEVANGNAITNQYATTVVDSKLQPELKTSVEFGAAINTLKNRLNFDIAYYNDKIDNQIGTIPLPGASGFNEMLTNIGAIKNKGVELSIVGKPIKSKNFNWTSTFNYWTVKTTISDLHELTGDFKNLYGSAGYGNYRVAAVAYEGGEYGVLYSDAAIDQDANGNNIMYWHDGVKAPYFKRIGKPVEVGNIRPDFEGSWDNEFSFKNFTFGFLMDVRIGGDVVSYPARYGAAYGMLETSLNGGDFDMKDIVAKGQDWTSIYSPNTNYTNGIVPKGVFAEGSIVTTPNNGKQDVSGMSWQEAADKGYIDTAVDEGSWAYWTNAWGTGVVNPNWVYDLSYVALRNISIGYDVRLPKYKIQNLKVGLNVRNVGYLYNSSPNNLNPEGGRGTGSASSAFHRTLLPYTRSYTMSLQFTF